MLPILKACNLDWGIVLSIYTVQISAKQACKQPITPTHNTSPRFSHWDAELGALQRLNEGNVHTPARLFYSLPPLSDWWIKINFFCEMESDQAFRGMCDLIDAEVIPSPCTSKFFFVL